MAIGGDLDPDRLVAAYSSGIFPWSSDPSVTWWCPDPRAVFNLHTFKASRSLRKKIRQSGWTFAVDTNFEAVMRGCAAATPDRPDTWISGPFFAAYQALHERGLAHSVEVYDGDALVAVFMGSAQAVFGGESMFHRTPTPPRPPFGILWSTCGPETLCCWTPRFPTHT